MVTKKSSGETVLRSHTHFRVIPLKFGKNGKNPDYIGKYIVYLEKGMQLLGKSSVLELAQKKQAVDFPKNKNLFDFQIANERNYTYIWSLYRVDDDGFEERVETKQFEVKGQIDQFLQKSQTSFTKDVAFDQHGFYITFSMIIQNTMDYIIKLTNSILGETPEETKASQKNVETVSEAQKAITEETEKKELDLKLQLQGNQTKGKAVPIQEPILQTPCVQQPIEQKSLSKKEPVSEVKQEATEIQKENEEKKKESIIEESPQKVASSIKQNPPKSLNFGSLFEKKKQGEQASQEKIDQVTETPENQPPPKPSRINKIALVIVILLILGGVIGATMMGQKSSKQKAPKKKNKKRK